MKIARITVYQITLPLEHPYRLSGGRLLFEKLDSTIVKIQTNEDAVGWGEACPWGSTYLPAFGKGVRAGIEEIAPQLIGQDPCKLDVINRVMDRALPAHPYVKSALDIACWDILGKTTGFALCDLLGGRRDEPVGLHSSIPTGTPDEMVKSVDAARAKGYRVHSCKVGGSDVYADIKRIKILTDKFGQCDELTFDANRAWLSDEAIQVMNATASFSAYFEQPCETFDECLTVRRLTRQPMILDECIHIFQDVVRAHQEHACQVISIKLNRLGGLTKARRIRDFCVTMGLRTIIEDTGGSVLADTAAVHLAQSTPITHHRATWLCHDMITVDIAPGQGARNTAGVTAAPFEPGIGVEPDVQVLGEPVAIFGG
ncbi:MAG: mandelate racemase/muconate lactonizing enzyme family protein [Gammaproteobacteria bacterium]|nr:mandelate racemase/muconate lactonizing enzyme family protein [Gammaproteobacteria bacterium]